MLDFAYILSLSESVIEFNSCYFRNSAAARPSNNSIEFINSLLKMAKLRILG
jgi:hypothetical protein